MRKITKQEKDFHKQQCINALLSDKNRARSISVGTAFGGTVELSMRGNDGSNMFVLMQPVEAIEFIHQLSAAVGCHITLRPRQDFSSWREWRDAPGVEIPSLIGSDTDKPQHRAAMQLPAPEQQPGLQPAMMARSENEQTLATQKTVGRKRTRRAAAAA